jgi:hypothetical protein
VERAVVPTGDATPQPCLKRPDRPTTPGRWLLGGCVIALIPTIFFFAQFARPGGVLNLIQFGTEFEATNVPTVAALHPPRNFPHGYDAQWYAQIAMDPLLRDPRTVNAVDDAGYRARRVVMPGLASMMGFGHPGLTLAILASLNYVFFLVLLVALIRDLKPAGPGQWAAVAAVALTTGSMDSLHRALSDLPASTLIFLAVILPLAATRVALLATAVLTRETAILSAVPCVLASPLLDRRNFTRLTLVLLPAAIWFSYLVIHLQTMGDGPSGNFQFPGAAIVERLAVAWSDLLAVPNDRRFFLLLAPVCLVVQAVFLWRFPLRHSALWWSGIGFTALLFVLGPMVWVGNMAAPRVLLPMTVAFNVLLATKRPAHFWIWFAAGNLGLLWGLRKLTIDLGLY